MTPQPKQKVIQVPGVGNVAFPADMSDEDIASKLRGNQPAATPPASPAATQTQEAPTIGANLSRFMDLTWNKINPWSQLQGMKEATWHPYMAVKGMLEAQGELAMKAKESFSKGDYASGLRHSIDYLMPLLGVELDEAGNKAASGDIVGSLADTTGIGINLATPALLGKAKGLGVPGLSKLTPKVTTAIRFLETEGVPVGAGVRTGSELVQGAEKLSEFSPGGAMVAMGTKAKQTAKLAETGEKLAGRAYPTPVSPEQAGAGVTGALEQSAKTSATTARGRYRAVEAAEANPANLHEVPTRMEKTVVGTDAAGNPITQMTPVYEEIPLPVDIRGMKPGLKSIVQRADEFWSGLTKHGSEGLNAVRTISKGPDFLPLTAAEEGLSKLKALLRETKDKRVAGQARLLIRDLQKTIDDAALEGGPDVLADLRAGRKATAIENRTQNVLDRIVSRTSGEPVQAYKQLIYSGDSGIAHLRKVAFEAPGEMPKVGRALIDDLLSKATQEGDFSREQGMLRAWQNIGPETRKVLFKDPKLIENLDNFFLGAKKLSEKVNPSGTALVGFIPAQAGAFIHDPFTGAMFQIGITGVAKLLKSQTGARLLAEGMKIPLGNKAAGGAIAAQLLRMAGDDAKKIEDRQLVPAMAQ